MEIAFRFVLRGVGTPLGWFHTRIQDVIRSCIRFCTATCRHHHQCGFSSGRLVPETERVNGTNAGWGNGRLQPESETVKHPFPYAGGFYPGTRRSYIESGYQYHGWIPLRCLSPSTISGIHFATQNNGTRVVIVSKRNQNRNDW